MKVLVIGGGGREHALVWKIAQSPKVETIYCAPGNGGISGLAQCVDIAATDTQGLLSFAKDKGIGLTVVGPEAPLSVGVVDLFMENGLRVFGPNKLAATLEGSKAFSKELMQKHGIPTARYETFTDADAAIHALDSFGCPVVIKADGLAAGKGVIIAQDREEAVSAIHEMMQDKKFGDAGSRVVIEEFLTGKEASILAFVDGKTAIPMVSAQDYKRALDKDMGLNTGGMGAVSPAFYYDEKTAKAAKRNIIEKTLAALNAEGITYKGVLYFGLMITEEGPKLLEYNARFGDPETEVVLPRLKSDLVDIMEAVIDGKLAGHTIEWRAEKAVGVVLASGGYPEEYKNGYVIEGLDTDAAEDAVVFHAGTRKQEDAIVTAGGRVLVVTALGETTEEARQKAYTRAAEIRFKDVQYRKDIAQR